MDGEGAHSIGAHVAEGHGIARTSREGAVQRLIEMAVESKPALKLEPVSQQTEAVRPLVRSAVKKRHPINFFLSCLPYGTHDRFGHELAGLLSYIRP
jgi:hypothetical protein